MRLDRVLAPASVLAALAGAAACLLPWETVEVSPLGAASTRPISAFHGTGIAACAGAALGLLAVAHGLARPGRSALRDATSTLAATLLTGGTAGFLLGPGQTPTSGPGYSVSVTPALVTAGVSGLVVLAITGVTAWRVRGRS